METGVLGPAVSHPKSMTLDWHECHPDTQAPLAGRQIPGWDRIRQDILRLASQLPFLKVVGWDLLLADDGLVAIEGNHHPDPDVLQCHGPLLTDERVRRFYQHYGIL